MILRWQGSIVAINFYWLIPVALFLMFEISLVLRYRPTELALNSTYEVRGLFHRSGGSSTNYSATLNGKRIYFDANIFGSGVSSEAGLIPNDSLIAGTLIDIKTLPGMLPFLVRAESERTIYFQYSSAQILKTWDWTTLLFAGVGAFILSVICLFVGLSIAK